MRSAGRLTTGRPIVNKAVYILDVRGNRVPISISTAVFKDQDGKIIGGVETFRDLNLAEDLRKELEANYSFAEIVGRSAAMRQVFQVLPQIAESTSTVLIEGASGTGKELFARAIHRLSPRRKKRFVALNCAALPDTLLESELFGYKAGAFTDAKKDKPGRFALADGGTIFLDEIGDISPAMQARLLRVLQDRTFEPLGSVEPVQVDVRVIAATNKDLAKLVRKGTFREDLFYRIHVVRIALPTLHDRREDIPLLIEHFIAKFNRLQGQGRGWRFRRSAGTPDGVRLPGQRARTGKHHRARFCPLPRRPRRTAPPAAHRSRHVHRREPSRHRRHDARSDGAASHQRRPATKRRQSHGRGQATGD